MPRDNLDKPPPLAHRILWTLLYEAERIFTSHSVQQFMLFDLRQELRARRRERLRGWRERKAISDALRYLTRVACVTETRQGRRRVWHLTPRGRLQAFATTALALRPLPRRRPAAGAQWLVIFDIPEKRRRLRDLFRRVLYCLDGEFLQKSVYLLHDVEGCRLLRHIIRTAQLQPHVAIAEIRRLER